MTMKDFSNADREILRALYSSERRASDDLPYTSEFESLYGKFIATSGRSHATRHDVWKALASLRKRAGLSRKMRA
jgi:hypothetical protein